MHPTHVEWINPNSGRTHYRVFLRFSRAYRLFTEKDQAGYCCSLWGGKYSGVKHSWLFALLLSAGLLLACFAAYWWLR